MKSKATFIWCFRAGDWLKSCIKDQNQNFNGLKNFGNVRTRLKWTLFLRVKTSVNLFVGAFWRTSCFGVCWQSRQPEVRRCSHIQGWISLQIGSRLPGMTPMLAISDENQDSIFTFWYLDRPRLWFQEGDVVLLLWQQWPGTPWKSAQRRNWGLRKRLGLWAQVEDGRKPCTGTKTDIENNLDCFVIQINHN